MGPRETRRLPDERRNALTEMEGVESEPSLMINITGVGVWGRGESTVASQILSWSPLTITLPSPFNFQGLHLPSWNPDPGGPGAGSSLPRRSVCPRRASRRHTGRAALPSALPPSRPHLTRLLPHARSDLAVSGVKSIKRVVLHT